MAEHRTQKLIASEWMTLDGVFDAGSMETWFHPYRSEERDEFIRQGVHGSDAVLVGRITYEMLASYWPHKKNNEDGIADRLNSMPKYVVSSSLKKADWNNSTIINNQVVERVQNLKQQPGKGIIIFGSAALVHSLMKANLIDEYRFLIHPFVMGNGKRFFQEGMPLAKLRLARSRALDSGVIASSYEPAGKPGSPS
jgi:dihydrofolate reductase